MKRCVISLVIGKAKIKTTRRYCFTPGRMAKVRKPDNDTCSRGYGEIGMLMLCWWECKMVKLQQVWQFLKKSNLELPHEPEKPLLGMEAKGLKMSLHTKLVHEYS